MLLLPGAAHALINGVTGPGFSLTASAGYISVADGASVYSWGYSTGGTMQLPGPTLIVTEGDMVNVTLTTPCPRPPAMSRSCFRGTRQQPAAAFRVH